MHARGDNLEYIKKMESERENLKRELARLYKEWEELHTCKGKDSFND